MGFFDKMKAANGLNLGHIESPDFPGGSIIIKDKRPVIINSHLNTTDYERVILQSEINVFKLIGCGGSWAKYYIEFKDGKNGIITQPVMTDIEKKQSKTTFSIAPIERFIRYVDNDGICYEQRPKTKKCVTGNQDCDEGDSQQLIINKNSDKSLKICPNCSASVTEDMVFCGECGRRLK